MTDPAPLADPRGAPRFVPFGRIQRVVAARMGKSHAEIPDFSMSVDVDVEDLLARRDELPADGRPSLNDFVLTATARALRRHPKVNSSCSADGIEIHARVNVGMAAAIDDGLLVVTVFDADTMTVYQIGRRTRELAEAVRGGAVALADLEGATFTVSNLGMFGVDRIVPIVIPGQVGILGVGAARPRVVPTDRDGVAVRRIVTLTLAGDHRVLNGTDGAGFLDSIRADLEQPEAMFSEAGLTSPPPLTKHHAG